MFKLFSNKFNISTGLKGTFLITKFDLSNEEVARLSRELQNIPPFVITNFLATLKELEAPLSRIDELTRLMAKRYINVSRLIGKISTYNNSQKEFKEKAENSLQRLEIDTMKNQLDLLVENSLNNLGKKDIIESKYQLSYFNALFAYANEIVFNYEKSAEYFNVTSK